MGRKRTLAAALRLHHDASLIMTNVQVMAQFVTGLNRTASEVMRVVYEKKKFPTEAVNFVTPGRRVRRAAHYMTAEGGSVAIPGNLVLKGYIDYYGSLLPQSQYVA